MTVEYKVTNPATGLVESSFPNATDAEILDAVAAAHDAFAEWRRSSVDERAAVLRRIADRLEQQADELAAIVSREMGKRVVDAKGEIGIAVSIARYYADHGAALMADEPRDTQSDGSAFVRKFPVGVLLGVMPWNYPYYQVFRFVAPNLMVGNTVVLKHAAQCPESALKIEQLLLEAGLPKGAYVNVFASHEQVEDIIANPHVQGVSVTGSERAGSAVAAVAGKHLKKVVLELGGSDPYLILQTDDVASAVSECVRARMSNGGQSCNAGKRFIVHQDLYEGFVAQLTASMSALTPGDPFDPASAFGPLASEDAATELISQIADALDHGAVARTGGTRPNTPGAFVLPTVLTDVTPAMRAYREELFGPVAVVHKVSDIDEAVDLANDSPYGLGAAVFHTDPEVAVAIADRLETGMVWINSREGGGAELPFGGVKRSGFGRELGPEGITEFVNRKLIFVPSAVSAKAGFRG